MTAADQKNAKILVVLLLIAGLTWYLVFRVNPTTVVSKGKKGGKAQVTTQVSGDSRIRLELLEESATSGVVGKRNLFQYGPIPPPPKPTQPTIVAVPPPPPPPVRPPGQPQPPPPPPFKQFRYDGPVTIGTTRKACVSEPNGNNYTCQPEGEVIMGTYKIVRITDSLVELEDLELKRRQSFPKVVVQ